MDHSFLNLNALDQRTSQYYEMLYARVSSTSGTQGVDGGSAVQFFQLSGLNMDVLREVWNLASVYKQPFLQKPEFFLYLKYVSLAQAGHFGNGAVSSYEQLKQFHHTLDLPRFQGVPLPAPPVQ